MKQSFYSKKNLDVLLLEYTIDILWKRDPAMENYLNWTHHKIQIIDNI